MVVALLTEGDRTELVTDTQQVALNPSEHVHVSVLIYAIVHIDP